MTDRLVTSGLLDEIEDAGLRRLIDGVTLVDEVGRHETISRIMQKCAATHAAHGSMTALNLLQYQD